MLKRIQHHHSFMWAYLVALLRGFLRPATIFLFFLCSTMIAIFATLFYSVEFGSNPKLVSFLDAIYFTVTTTTGVGYGDIVPLTASGKILAMFMMIVGTAFFVSFTALLAAALIEVESFHKKA